MYWIIYEELYLKTRSLNLVLAFETHFVNIGMVWEQLAFDDAVSDTQRGNGLQQS